MGKLKNSLKAVRKLSDLLKYHFNLNALEAKGFDQIQTLCSD